MTNTKWFERKFEFNFQDNILPELIDRLSKTENRLEELVKAKAEDRLTIKPDQTWSIKENIGHLNDLEPLWQGRLDDIMNDQEFLRPTDLENKKTDLANHNAQGIGELLSKFRTLRSQTIDQLSALSESDVYKSALHPRLKTPMRVMDLFYFVAEHDDHHTARIQEILENS